VITINYNIHGGQSTEFATYSEFSRKISFTWTHHYLQGDARVASPRVELEV